VVTFWDSAKSKEAPDVTHILMNVGEASMDVQKECLRDNPLSVLDPNYQGIVGPGDPGVYPLPLPGYF
jgi:hypothetical protein